VRRRPWFRTALASRGAMKGCGPRLGPRATSISPNTFYMRFLPGDLVGSVDMAGRSVLAAVAALAVAGHRRERHRDRGVRGVAHSWPAVRPDLGQPESVGALDVMSCVLEFGLIVGCAALLWRPALLDKPVARRGAVARAAVLLAAPAAVIAATTAVMTPGWAGPEGPAGMAPGTPSGASAQSSSSALNSGMGDMGTTDGRPDRQMYGSTAPPTAAQVLAAAQLVKQTDASLQRYTNVHSAFAAGLNPQDPSSLVYATRRRPALPVRAVLARHDR
jgi:hypothetical protein